MLTEYVTRVTLRPFLRVVALILAGAMTAHADTDLGDLGSRHLPYRAKVAQHLVGSRVLDAGACRPVIATRIDSTDVVFTARNPGIVRADEGPVFSSVPWQHNLPPEFCHRQPCASLDGLWDVDGDGDPELVLISPTADRRHWLLQALDTADGSLVTDLRLEGGPEHRSDGRWDGAYTVVGVAEVAGSAGMRRAFLIVSMAGFDREPRGVMAVDTRTGTILWTDFTGAKPRLSTARGADLDGDGVPEVVYMGVAVKNLPAPVNGLGDDVCSLVAVNADGTRRWVNVQPEAISGHLEVVSTPERAFVLAALAGAPGHPPRLLVLDADTGTVVSSADLPGVPRGLACAADQGGIDCYLGIDGVGIQHYRFTDSLQRINTAFSNELLHVWGLGELLPVGGAQVLASAVSGAVYVLDRDLEPLVFLGQNPQSNMAGGVVVYPNAGRPPLLRVLGHEDAGGLDLRFEPNPRPIPWAALALLPVAGGTWYLRRRRRGASAATVRELRLQLLSRLELSNHGAIGALRSLRRLVWILDALAQAEGGSADLEARLSELRDECGRHMLPELAGTLELAQLARCDAPVVGRPERPTSALPACWLPTAETTKPTSCGTRPPCSRAR